jgi:Glycosyl hydrolases family 43/F5/8 type C domain/Domain of Unknown Function (DUF1080)
MSHHWLVLLITFGFWMLRAHAASADEKITGMVGVGTWGTQAEFKDITVTKGQQVVFRSDFSKGMQDWKAARGKWEVVDGALRQTSTEEDARALVGAADWSDYTLTLKARKISGNEGFLILFGLPKPDANFKSWWNVGGWSNEAHGLQSPDLPEERVAGKIETGRWYDVKLEVMGGSVKAYLDGQLIQSAEKPSAANAQREFPHALIPDMLADPSIVEINGTFYCYATTDGAGAGLSTSGLPVVWKSKDFLNWSFEGSIFPENFEAKYWAPSAPVLKDGRWYLFPTLDNKITATVADKPEGPFKTLDGKDFTKTSGWKQFPISVGHPIDAEFLKDDDGSYYMAWSKNFIAKMNRDFSGFEGEPMPVRVKRGGYSEGPCMFKRKGIYYYLYTLGGNESYQYAYMTSKVSPTGPWDGPQQDIIATTDHAQGIYGPGHGCFVNPTGTDDWYFVYLEYGRSSTNRQICAAKMHFNADGSIQPIQLSLKGVGAIRKDPAAQAPNLAAGKAAKASSVMDEVRIRPTSDPRFNRIESFEPSQALDDSNGSRWMAKADDAKPWFTVDLGAVKQISKTAAYFVKPTAGQAYQIEYSVDGKSWTGYASHPEIEVKSPHVDAKSVKARYVRLTILKGTTGLWDFRVY